MSLNKPIIVKDLEKFKKNNYIWKVHDIYQKQLEELFEITYPNKRAKFVQKKKHGGNWIYFPWSGQLIHTINEQDYYTLRTNRNRNLITVAEQKKLNDFTVGVVGLSVGGNIAVGLTFQGIGKSMKLADFDRLETTNLNRVRAGIHQVGLSKTDLIAQQIYEINPYANLKLYPKGLTKNTLDDFVNGKPKPKLIFEIIDDFEMKIRLRIKARAAGIPVMMFTNLGDSIQIDIERYDLDKKLPLFNGIIGDLPEEILKNPKENPNKYAVKIVGLENVPKRALESVKQIGKTLVGRPQLNSTVTISAGLGSYFARLIALGQPLPSGRKMVVFDNVF